MRSTLARPSSASFLHKCVLTRTLGCTTPFRSLARPFAHTHTLGRRSHDGGPLPCWSALCFCLHPRTLGLRASVRGLLRRGPPLAPDFAPACCRLTTCGGGRRVQRRAGGGKDREGERARRWAPGKREWRGTTFRRETGRWRNDGRRGEQRPKWRARASLRTGLKQARTRHVGGRRWALVGGGGKGHCVYDARSLLH